MEEWFFERIQSANPHLRGGEGVHPNHQATALRIGIGRDCEICNLLGGGEQGLVDEFERQVPGLVQTVGHSCCVGGDLFERSRAIKMLGAADEPDFGGGEGFH